MKPSTKLKCNTCGSRNTVVARAKDIARITGDDAVLTAAAGAIALADPVLLIEIARVVIESLKKFLGYKIECARDKRMIVVCRSCGFWQTLGA